MLAACIVFAITILAIIAYACGTIRMEMVSVALIASLILLFYLFGYSEIRLMSAFSNPALITVMGVLIISSAVTANNSFSMVNNIILHPRNKYPFITMGLVLFVAFILSAFVNNTAVVAIFIPLLSLMVQKFGISASKLMMPLAFTASLGSLLTVLGSSTNLLIYGRLSEVGYTLGIFDFFLPGLIISAFGLVYTIIILPRILPDITPVYSKSLVDKFIVRVTIADHCNFIGEDISDVNVISDLHIIALFSNNKYFYDWDKRKLSAGDVIFVNLTKEDFTNLLSNQAGLIINDSNFINQDGTKKEGSLIQEVILLPNSCVIGKKLKEINDDTSCKALVVGVQRASNLFEKNMHDIVLRAGDTILLSGSKGAIRAFIQKYNFTNSDADSHCIPTKSTNAPLINVVFFGMIALVAFQILPIMLGVMMGISALLILRCITIKQMQKAFDIKIFLNIVSAYMLSVALQDTGGLKYILDLITSVSTHLSPIAIMSILFISIALLNEVMSNNAVGLIFVPIVMGIVEITDADPRLFVYGLIFASNCAFSTPIAYQTNLLVMEIGNYKFTDYYRVGLPLTILIYLTYVTFAYFYF